jgi:hypothetical protein
VADAAKAAPTRAADTSTIGLLLFAAGLVVIGLHIVHPDFVKISKALGIPLKGVQAAWTFSRKRGLPFAWVLATILVESGGRADERGDAGGESVGLMQVNTHAHAKEIAAAGLTPEALLNPTTNVDWGTRVYADIYNKVKAAMASSGGQRVKTGIDVSTRLAYKNPSVVTNAIRRGEEPSAISWAHPAIENWRAASARVAAATGGGPAKLPFV